MMKAAESNAQANAGGIGQTPACCPHIVFASLMRPHGQTGVQSTVWRLFQTLKLQNPQCELITPFGGNPVWSALFSVRKLLLVRINKNWSTRWYRYWHGIAVKQNLKKYVRCHRPEWIVAQCPLTALAALDVRDGAELSFKVALVCHFNGSQAEEFQVKGELNDQATIARIHQAELTALQSVDGVIYNSNWLRDVLERKRNIIPKRATVIWHGIPDDKSVNGLSRQDLGMGNCDIVLMNVGTLEPRKNQIGLVHLFSQLLPIHPQSRLVLVGDGPDRNDIESLIRQLDLKRSVHVLGERSDVPQLLALADVYVHFSSVESFGIVLLEAARAGMPIAAPVGSGMGEVLHELEGYVELSPDSIEQSARALHPLMTSSSERKKLGERNRRNFQRQFSIESSAQRYLQALNAWQHHND